MEGYRFKLKNENIELEIEGSEQFITNLLSILPELNKELRRIDFDDPETAPVPKIESIDDILKLDFSQWKRAISNDSDELFPFVLAGYYLQRRNTGSYFTTKEVFSLLYQHGILITDIYKCEMHNLEVKNIIKVGILKGKPKYRVNPDKETTKLLHEILECSLID